MIKGIIYSIESPSTNKIYIGSTTTSLNTRWSKHKYEYKTSKNRFRYTCFKIMDYGDADIKMLKEVECNDVKELRMIEGQYIKDFKNICVNRCIAGRTKKQWTLDNIEKIRKQKREYYYRNRDKLKQKYKEYNKRHLKDATCKVNCECGSTIQTRYFNQHIKTQKHRRYIRSLKTKN